MTVFKIINRIASLIVLGALATFASCEGPETISLETSQPVVFIINEAAVNSSGKDYDVTANIDLRQNPDAMDYLNRIEAVEIVHIEYAVSDANPQDISLNNAAMETSAKLDIIGAKSISLSNSSTGEFVFNAPGINDLETRLRGSGYDVLNLFGGLTRTPLACKVTVTFHLNIKARAN
jgi:hypothetical protein